jgi:hypothetical protein
MNLKPHITSPETAKQVADWLRTRGGIAIWQSADIGFADRTLTTPANTTDGQPYPKPAWWVDAAPCVITDFADVLVSKDRPVKRFPVGLCKGSGLQMICTAGATRRIKAELAKAGEDAFHVFDYDTGEAVIMLPVTQVPLLEYLRTLENPDMHLVKS